MTKDEAIKVLENEIKCVDRDCDIERSCGKCPYAMPTKEPILEAYNMSIKALKQYGALQEIQKEICDMYPNYTDEKGYRMIRKSDVLNIIDKHIKEIEE